jgi:non-ribosomal peptide synthetase component F
MARLDFGFERAPAAEQAGANHLMSVDTVVADRLKQVAQRAGVTLFTVLLAALEMVLAPYADGPDFVIAVPVAGRGSDGAEGVIGPFANIVGLKTNLRAGQTGELLADVGRQLLDTLGMKRPPGMRWCAPAILTLCRCGRSAKVMLSSIAVPTRFAFGRLPCRPIWLRLLRRRPTPVGIGDAGRCTVAWLRQPARQTVSSHRLPPVGRAPNRAARNCPWRYRDAQSVSETGHRRRRPASPPRS